jgi:superfamily II DNA or RNA helicase
MSLEEWQIQLRRQFGSEQNFRLQNLGEHPVFSEFLVTNPERKTAYRVAIRGQELGENFCSCPDFATNTLGTCKHVEFALFKLRRSRATRKLLGQKFQPAYSEVYLHYGAAREVRFRPGTDCPPELARLAATLFDTDGRLLESAAADLSELVTTAHQLQHELRLYDDVQRLLAEIRDRAARAKRLDEVFSQGPRSPALDGLLKVPMYPYQKEGALFAARAGRALLADDMGLGKTIQALAAAEIMGRYFGVERALVVCPTSLKHQWEREIGRFTERSAVVIGGMRLQRQELYQQESFYKITNYDTVHTDLDLIEGWSPDLVILDEAQRIKNWETRVARSVKKISSPYCVVLTGTPLENRLEELVSIVQFVDQQRLGPTFRFLHQHQVREGDTGRVVGYRDLDQIGRTLQGVMLRRHKKEVLSQLPQRLNKRFFVPMTQEQWQHHDANREIVARIVAKWQRYKFLSERDKQRLMVALQYMRMSCDSTYLLDQTTDFGRKAGELITLIGELVEEQGAKVVVFSQWVRMHELLQRRLAATALGHVFFHGGVPSPKRKAIVDRFREDDNCRVFLATDAGGVGLNLQHASVVVNVDLPWNPAVLEQRIGRVHRLGQTQPVQVVDFVASQTIEEGMLSVLSFKQNLASGILDDGEKEVFLGKSRLNKFIETVQKVTGDIPTQPPEDVEHAAAESPEPADEDADERPAAGRASPRAAAPRPSPSGAGSQPASPPSLELTVPPAGDPLGSLIAGGLALLQQLVQGVSPEGEGPGVGAGTSRPVQVARDPKTGKRSLTITLLEGDVLERALSGIQTLLESLRR